jgi:hypothetical protein
MVCCLPDSNGAGESLVEAALDRMRRTAQQIGNDPGSDVEKRLMMDAMAKLDNDGITMPSDGYREFTQPSQRVALSAGAAARSCWGRVHKEMAEP